jgi:hypothetical protein
MRKAIIIITATLTLAALDRLSAIPLDIGRPAPAGSVVAAASIDLFELTQQVGDLPVQEVEDYSMVGDRSAGQ